MHALLPDQPFIWKYDMDLLGDTNIGNYLGKRYIRCSKHDRKWIEVQVRMIASERSQ